MKKISILLVLVFFALGFSVSAQNTPSPVDKVVKFSKVKYDIGKIKHNEPTTFYMEFTNIGKKPVVIENVMVGCGCTVAEKPTAPIMPGKTGKIKVGYNGSAAPGSAFTKDVTVKVAGISEPKTILFTGETEN
ncbi:MAG: DUF1573 domain-containing protein [Niabella sp.]